MVTTRYPVDCADTDQALHVLFRHAHAHDVEQGGRDDPRSAAIHVGSHHWLHLATHQESEPIGTFYFRWEPPALGCVKPGDVLQGEDPDDDPRL